MGRHRRQKNEVPGWRSYEREVMARDGWRFGLNGSHYAPGSGGAVSCATCAYEGRHRA